MLILPLKSPYQSWLSLLLTKAAKNHLHTLYDCVDLTRGVNEEEVPLCEDVFMAEKSRSYLKNTVWIKLLFCKRKSSSSTGRSELSNQVKPDRIQLQRGSLEMFRPHKYIYKKVLGQKFVEWNPVKRVTVWIIYFKQTKSHILIFPFLSSMSAESQAIQTDECISSYKFDDVV